MKKGIWIENYNAAEIYGYNIGTREYLSPNKSVLSDSLLTRWLVKNDLTINKNETKDVVGIGFSFGHNDVDGERAKINRMANKVKKEIKELEELNINKKIKNVKMVVLQEKLKSYDRAITKTKELYNNNPEASKSVSKGDLRKKYYNNKTVVIDDINYNMLYRSTSKAKEGSTVFINSKLYDKTYDWMTMGLGNRADNKKIVEMSAYMGLVASSIIDTIRIKPSEILFLEDRKSSCMADVNIVKVKNGICDVEQEQIEISNVIWDGQSLIDADFLNEHMKNNNDVKLNSMVLLRNHFFKSCAFKTRIKDFMKDTFGDEYETKVLKDMFGEKRARNIKLIVTDNSLKWLKFKALMGNTDLEAYQYWRSRLRDDNYIFGIVKTDHPSKLGSLQKMSAQMINSLELTKGKEKEEIKEIARHGVGRATMMKEDNDEFIKFLRERATQINNYSMIADLYGHNPEFANNRWWRTEKRKIIHSFVNTLRCGEIPVSGDNLTVVGNPYALLLHAIGRDWEQDNTLTQEDDAIQCYTKQFESNKYIAGFRSPHNSPHNILYLHNVDSDILDRYFDFSENIIVINMIKTVAQSRANGMDMDSDFIFGTDDEVIVRIAKNCFEKYKTIVNKIKEETKEYKNDRISHSDMDNDLAKAQDTIGKSSNMAQRALSWFYDGYSSKGKFNRELEKYIIILATLAQVAIDQCKKSFEIDPDEEVKRISSLPIMKGKKSPRFMHWVNDIKKDNTQLYKCPMDYLQKEIDAIPRAKSQTGYENKLYFKFIGGKANYKHKRIIEDIVEAYDNKIRKRYANDTNKRKFTKDDTVDLLDKTNRLAEKMERINVDDKTMNRLIAEVFIEENNILAEYRMRLLNALYNRYENKSKFLNNFNDAETVLREIEKEKSKKKEEKCRSVK